MKLHIIGKGSCQAGDFDVQDLEDGISINTKLLKTSLPRTLKRLSGRLAKMVCYAATEAITDAGYTHIENLPVIYGSAMSEIDSGRQLISQIHESAGASISPTLVQNSVHNAPAGFLSIGLGITAPVMTVCNSFLSNEAVLDYAVTFLATSSYREVLVISGDQYRSHWSSLLEGCQLSRLAQELKEMNFTEGISALVLSQDETGKQNYGYIKEAAVVHLSKEDKLSKELLNEFNFFIGPETNIIIRDFCQDRIKDPVELAESLEIPAERIHLITKDMGTSLTFPISNIINYGRTNKSQDLMFLSSEFDDIAIVHYHLEAFL